MARPGLIDRHDLVAALDHAAEKKATVISAPAGSGKTSLLRVWAGRPVRTAGSPSCRCGRAGMTRSCSGSPFWGSGDELAGLPELVVDGLAEGDARALLDAGAGDAGTDDAGRASADLRGPGGREDPGAGCGRTRHARRVTSRW
ncbi:MAG TPA: hypothetical protein VGJ54_03720 [Streptosporangiaceae bacterium]|jgi:hypothetical protein